MTFEELIKMHNCHILSIDNHIIIHEVPILYNGKISGVTFTLHVAAKPDKNLFRTFDMSAEVITDMALTNNSICIKDRMGKVCIIGVMKGKMLTLHTLTKEALINDFN